MKTQIPENWAIRGSAELADYLKLIKEIVVKGDNESAVYFKNSEGVWEEYLMCHSPRVSVTEIPLSQYKNSILPEGEWYIKGCLKLKNYFAEIGVNGDLDNFDQSKIVETHEGGLEGRAKSWVYFMVGGKWNGCPDSNTNRNLRNESVEISFEQLMVALEYNSNRKLAVKGCPELNKYFREIGVNSNGLKFNPELTARGNSIGGHISGYRYYINDSGKWDYTESNSFTAVSLEEYLSSIKKEEPKQKLCAHGGKEMAEFCSKYHPYFNGLDISGFYNFETNGNLQCSLYQDGMKLVSAEEFVKEAMKGIEANRESTKAAADTCEGIDNMAVTILCRTYPFVDELLKEGFEQEFSHIFSFILGGKKAGEETKEPETKKPEPNKIAFKKFLAQDMTVREALSEPKHFLNVEHVGRDRTYGDVFKAWSTNPEAFTIYFGTIEESDPETVANSQEQSEEIVFEKMLSVDFKAEPTDWSLETSNT